MVIRITGLGGRRNEMQKRGPGPTACNPLVYGDWEEAWRLVREGEKGGQ